MPSVSMIRATVSVTDFCFRHAFPLYARCYDLYKARTDRDIIRLMHRIVRPGDHVADIGANVGFYSRLLARLVGDSGHVYAFEPDDANFEKLVARTRPFLQVHTVRGAVADRPGRRTLYRSSNLNVDHRTFAIDEEREQVSVDAVSLDSYLANSGEPLHLIKMDIQGGEYPALCGMGSIVARSPDLVILMELWPFVYDRFGAGTSAVLALLASWGFEVRRIVPGPTPLGATLSADATIPERVDPNAYFDVICARPTTLRQMRAPAPSIGSSPAA